MTPTPDVRVHPIAALFPMMGESELAALAQDIKVNGIREPIWVHQDGSILDGRNRHAACALVNVSPKFRYWDGEESEVAAFVASMNLHRRHLSEAQRASIAAHMANMRPRDTLVPAAKQHKQAGDSLVPPDGGTRETLISASEAAKVMNVSKRSVERARAVQMHAPDLEPEVLAGKVSLSSAADVAAERARGTTPAPTVVPAPPDTPSKSVDMPRRNALLARTHHRRHNEMAEKVFTALEGICDGIRMIEIAKLDPSRVATWTSRAEESLATLRKFYKEIQSVKAER